jgi:RNA polymerase sigma-70 factor (family 1)
MAVRTNHESDSRPVPGLPCGGETAFTSTFRQYYAPLVLYAYRITDNQGAAEDIVEEAFVSLWNKRDAFGEIKSLKSYLYTIARNKCLSWMKKNQRDIKRHQASSSFEEEFDRTALENMIYAESMGKIYMAIDKLPRQCRKVFIMHYIDGMKISEIAKELKLSIHTINAHKGRGIDLLQKVLLNLLFLVLIYT